MSYRVAVVGATGVVGTEMLRILVDRGFPASEIVPMASARSAGKTVPIGGEQVTVVELADGNLDGFDIAIFSAGGGTSAEWAPKFAAAGAIVVDNSSHWRMFDDIPLVVAEVNPGALDAINEPGSKRIISNPNCSTMQMVVPLKALHEAAALQRVVVTTMQSVSGTGKAAIDELRAETAAIVNDQNPPAPHSYPHQIAFNVISAAGSFKDGSDYTDEETKLINETRKIMSLPNLAVTATCTRVPVYVGHSESVNIQTELPLSADQARELLAAQDGVRVVDDPASMTVPMPIDAAGEDDVLVGRIRVDESAPNSLNLFIVGDNLLKGAALNAVQIAEALVSRKLI
ncbi:MAG: aspartate-semialdehyde dehydrogenase [Solirubrobacterales bacterium]|nr:aspartate-semialdehyde dehydrogenase [Solirubrobacterales bacterium]